MLGNIIFCFRRRDLGTAYTMGKGKVNNTAVTFFFLWRLKMYWYGFLFPFNVLLLFCFKIRIVDRKVYKRRKSTLIDP